jgi:hypothetical protein
VPRLLDTPNIKYEARIYGYDAAGIKAHCISGRIEKYTNLNCSEAGRAKTSSKVQEQLHKQQLQQENELEEGR